MSELIPIGTVNRAPTENNKNKAAQEGVEATTRSKNLADEDQHPRVERRRKSNRRHRRAERRLLNKSSTRLGRDRRKTSDRRSRVVDEAKTKPEAKKQERRPLSKKGRIIDERI